MVTSILRATPVLSQAPSVVIVQSFEIPADAVPARKCPPQAETHQRRFPDTYGEQGIPVAREIKWMSLKPTGVQRFSQAIMDFFEQDAAQSPQVEGAKLPATWGLGASVAWRATP